MKKFFANIWTKRVFALVSLLYTYCACKICYFSLFYDIHIHARVSQCLILTGVSILALVVMLYTRKQVVTRIASFIILPAMLPAVLLYFGEWGFILPIVITGILILLLSGAGEGAKTAFGTIILLLYIFGALGYFLFTSFFVTSAQQTVVASGVSPSGKYRYRVVNTQDRSNGSTAVYVEPNYTDKKYPFVTFSLKNMERIVILERPICEEIDVQWQTQARQDITAQLNSLSGSIAVDLTDEQKKKIGYTETSRLVLQYLNTDQKLAIGRKASDVSTITLDELNDQQLAYFNIARDEDGKYYGLNIPQDILTELGKTSESRVYLTELDQEQLDYFFVTYDDSVYLNELTDQQLEALDVEETGDIMTFNGVVCFRAYVAENYFDVDSRKISINLLG